MDARSANPAAAEKRVLPARVICVLWHPPGRSVDPELAGVLSRWQGLLVTECSSAPAAIAHLACLERTMRKEQREATVLLLIEPEKLSGVCDVLCVLDKFSPTTRAWCYESGSPEMLRAITPVDVARFTRVSLQRQQARRPETTPQIHVVAQQAQLNRTNSQVGSQGRSQVGPADLRLAQSGSDVPAHEKAPGAIPVVPRLTLQTNVDSDVSPAQNAGKASDNAQNSNPKMHNGISNVLTPEEMAMLLADDDKSRHG